MSSNEIVERKCDKCGIIRTIDKFRKYTDKENSFSKTCKKCLNEQDKLRKKNLRQKKLETLIAKCEKCQEKKLLKEFSKLKKFYKKKICISCYPRFLTEQKNEWCKNESNTNINYRLKKSIASRLRSVIIKNSTTMNYIGCNIQYLREWFEYNFTKEMNWDNYGSYWTIDHVIPVHKFDLTDETEILKCWNWSNLMPVQLLKKVDKNGNQILAPPLQKVDIDMNQVTNIIQKLENFKEEGSTTKWFSKEFVFNLEFAESKAKK